MESADMVEGQTIYVMESIGGNRFCPMAAKFQYYGDCDELWCEIFGHFDREYRYRTVSYPPNRVFTDRAKCKEACHKNNNFQDYLQSLTDEEWNDYEYSRYLSRYFDRDCVCSLMNKLRNLPDYGNVEVKVSQDFTEDGGYAVYYRHFSPPPAIPPVQHNKKETPGEKKERLERYKDPTFWREQFLRKWTQLEQEG